MSNGNNRDTAVSHPPTRTRRHVLRSGIATGGLLTVGLGSMAGVSATDGGRWNDAPGRGGQAVVPEAVYRSDATFSITERTGESEKEISGITFQCTDAAGHEIFLVGWHFEYDDGEGGIFYSRSNNIDTEKDYAWRPLEAGAKLCEGGIVLKIEEGDPEVALEDGIQTSFRAIGPQ